MVSCPICDKNVSERNINAHIDSGCQLFLESEPPPSTAPVASFFKTPTIKREANHVPSTQPAPSPGEPPFKSFKRPLDDVTTPAASSSNNNNNVESPLKKLKHNAFQKAAPLAERMRPTTLDEVCGQELVGPSGVLRGLIESDRVPSMILWGNAGTGKTTIARVIANMVGSRFVEINSTSSGVAECKKIFAEARSELGLTGRKTIIFCDEIHRFSKSQQDVFLGPVEAGHVTLIGATTENPSFKVQNALLSRCRTFTLAKLTDQDIIKVLNRALDTSRAMYQPGPLVDEELLNYLAAFADGDARTSLNLLELAMDLSKRPDMTSSQLKSALTKTLVYDRSGDQHYDTISALHKSVRGSDPDAALYYLARMIQSGEDALYIARRMIVMASEDVGLADSSMLSLATATYAAAEKLGLPEAKINLAHCAVALSLAPKSTRVYRGLSNAMAALDEPGIAGLPIPIHLRNAPTRLMKELGYGKEYKYNPMYRNGRVKQDYLPDKIKDRKFLEDLNLGTERDSEVEYSDEDDVVNGTADDNTELLQTEHSEPVRNLAKHDSQSSPISKPSSQTPRIFTNGTRPDVHSLSQPNPQHREDQFDVQLVTISPSQADPRSQHVLRKPVPFQTGPHLHSSFTSASISTPAHDTDDDADTGGDTEAEAETEIETRGASKATNNDGNKVDEGNDKVQVKEVGEEEEFYIEYE